MSSALTKSVTSVRSSVSLRASKTGSFVKHSGSGTFFRAIEPGTSLGPKTPREHLEMAAKKTHAVALFRKVAQKAEPYLVDIWENATPPNAMAAKDLIKLGAIISDANRPSTPLELTQQGTM